MSTDAKTNPDGFDDFDLPLVSEEVISTGAAADSAQSDERLMALPRLLRYAMLISKGAQHVEERIFAEIYELCPNLELASAWIAACDAGLGVALAAELDHRAVSMDQSELRSLADCVRLLSLPVPRDLASLAEHRRVTNALLQTYYNSGFEYHEDLRGDLEEFCFGWAALPTCIEFISSKRRTAAVSAVSLGSRMASARVRAAMRAVRKQVEAEEKERERLEAIVAATADIQTTNVDSLPEHHVVVATIESDHLKNTKLKEVVASLKGAFNTALPLVRSPALPEVREKLNSEFPYARDAVDAVLNDLVGRATVKLRPLLLVGEPGGGKSRFVRRLGEALGVFVWRTDASRSDGAAFAGTDKRWHSAEPCHPFLAISRAKHANPLVLLDELEKAGTRADYGRLWDCLLGFLEPETNDRYPDPALQTNLDLSHISYVATANCLEPLPAPIRDRFRIIDFPKPKKDDLDALLPGVIADIARQRDLDTRWVLPLDGGERAAVEAHWRGGSVRHLHRIVHAVLRERDILATRN